MAAAESITAPPMLPVTPGRTTMVSGSMGMVEPLALTVALVMSPLPVTVAAVSRFRSRTVPLMPMFRVEPVARSSTVTLLATPPPMPRKEAGERLMTSLMLPDSWN